MVMPNDCINLDMIWTNLFKRNFCNSDEYNEKYYRNTPRADNYFQLDLLSELYTKQAANNLRSFKYGELYEHDRGTKSSSC